MGFGWICLIYFVLLRDVLSLCAIPQTQYEALELLYNSTDGPSWFWNETTPSSIWTFPSNLSDPCDGWQGISCEYDQNSLSNCSIVELRLSRFHLVGYLPAELMNLNNLTLLDLSINRITGPLPLSLSTNMIYLNLSSNYLTGSVPSEWGHMTSLVEWLMYGNEFDGSFPDIFDNFKSLSLINLAQNKFNGTFPTSIQYLTGLQTLRFGYNNFSGPIPLNFASLSSLEDLQFDFNNFVGTLPSELALLSHLEVLSFSRNLLSGSLPEELSDLKYLRYLELSDNSFRGTIPVQYFNMTSLIYISMGQNHFTGSLMSQLGKLKHLQVLDLQKNSLYGTIPTELGHLFSLEQLYLLENSLIGEIPSEFGGLESIVLMYLGINSLTGVIPSEIARLKYLKIFDVQSNSLSGNISLLFTRNLVLSQLDVSSNYFSGDLPFLFNNSNLLLFDGYSNLFSGSLPDVFSNDTNLFSLDLSSNFLHGSLPPGICNLTNFQDMYLYSNHLSGTIPSGIGDLSLLRQLNIASNNIHGTIPSSIGNLKHLDGLNFSSCFLTGSLPSQLGQLKFLSLLELQGNRLEGQIPSQLGSLTSIRLLYLNSNLLTGTIPDLSSLRRLQYLSLNSNSIGGSIPITASNLSSLVQLDLSSNNFEFSIPSSFGSSLEFLYLACNALTGTIPSTISLASNLTVVWLQSNSLFGQIPAELFDLNHLQQINLFDNGFSGTIPSDFSKLKELTLISLSNNNFFGTIPLELRSLPALQNINFTSNQLTGNLYSLFAPSDGVVFPSLTSINLGYNALTGTLPSSIFSIKSLQVLALYSNCFKGYIPNEICDAKALEVIVLDRLSGGSTCEIAIPEFVQIVIKGIFTKNLLQGAIPGCIWSLPNLTTLHLSGNGLEGSIGYVPPTSKLSIVNIAHNVLSGSIPESLQQFGLEQFLAENNKLDGTLSYSYNLDNTKALKLTDNRLSGFVPKTFRDNSVETLVVLDGNLFQCTSNQDLPANDPDSLTYECGSSGLNDSMFLLVTTFGSFVILGSVVYMLYHRFRTPEKEDVDDLDFEKNETDSSAFRPKNFSLYSLFLECVEKSCHWATIDFEGSELLSQYVQPYLTVLYRASYGACALALSYLVVCMSSYVLLKTYGKNVEILDFSTHTFQYGWIITSAYLHGLIPAILILVYLLLSVSALSINIGLNKVKLIRGDSDRVVERKSLLQSIFGDAIKHPCDRLSIKLRNLSIVLTLQLLNIFVTLLVNICYVTALIRGQINPASLFMLQGAVSMYKLVWSAFYVPWALTYLSFQTDSQQLRHQVFMYIFNYIVGPCIATAASDSNCFYDVIGGQDQVIAVYDEPDTENYCSGLFTQVGLSGSVSFLETSCTNIVVNTAITLQLNPPFIYSYQCSSALLIDYVPVLIYAYAISSIVVPIVRFLLLHISAETLRKFLPSLLMNVITNSILSPEPNNRSKIASGPLFHGSVIVAKRMMDFAVLLTFGLACPALGAAVALNVLSNTVLWHMHIGRYVYLSGGPSNKSAMTLLKDCTAGVSKGVLGCTRIVVGSACLFWGLMLFDMIGDVYGNLPGILVTLLTACCMPILSFVVTRVSYTKHLIQPIADRISRMTSFSKSSLRGFSLDSRRTSSGLSEVGQQPREPSETRPSEVELRNSDFS